MKAHTATYPTMVMLMMLTASLVGNCQEKKQAIITPDKENGKVYVYTGPAEGKPEGICVPSLYMEAQCIDKDKPEVRQQSPSGCCLKYTVHLDKDPGWCGVVWSKAPSGDNPTNWAGTPTIPAYNLKGAKKLIVHLKGQRGGESLQIKLGVLGDKPYGDSLPSPVESKWFKLTTEWRQFEIEIPDDTDLSRVFTPMSWVANNVHQPVGMNTIIFYIDDCYFEF